MVKRAYCFHRPSTLCCIGCGIQKVRSETRRQGCNTGPSIGFKEVVEAGIKRSNAVGQFMTIHRETRQRFHRLEIVGAEILMKVAIG